MCPRVLSLYQSLNMQRVKARCWKDGRLLQEFGVRSEVNMLVRSGKSEVTSIMQGELVII